MIIQYIKAHITLKKIQIMKDPPMMMYYQKKYSTEIQKKQKNINNPI